MWKKIKAWFKKYWKLILIIPSILIAAQWTYNKFIVNIFNKKRNDTNPEGDKTDQRVNTIKNEANEKIGKIEDDLGKIKKGIDEGSPTAAEIFNRTIKKK